MMVARKGVRILVVEDHPVTRLGIVAVLHASGRFDVIGQAETAHSAVLQFRELRPDVTLLDLKLPDGSGIDVLERIRTIDPEARVLVLTSIDTEEQAYRALQAKVNGYLMKDTPPQRLVDAVSAIVEGRAAFTEALQRAVGARREQPDLTPRELDVLRLVAAGLTNVEIGHALGIGMGTARTHVSAIFEKLQVATRTEAATAAMKRGIV